MIEQMMQEQFVAAERERQARIARAWQRYHGDWPRPLRSTKSDPQGEDNVTVNYARLIVDKGVGFLFGWDLDFEVDGQRESAAEAWLEACLKANRKMTTFHKLGVNGAVGGHTFVKVLPADAGRYGHPYPRLVVWDPACVSLRWNPEDCEEILSYTYQWHGVHPQTAQPCAYRQVVEREGDGWLISDQESPGASCTWRTLGEPQVWPFSWSPVFHCQNLPCPNAVWGLSDLEEDVLRANQALNFVWSNLNRILRLHAHPRTWGKGFNASQLDVAVDATIVLPGEKGELHNLEMLSDLSSSLEFGRRLKEALHELARVPEVATGKVEDLGQLSGLALQILYGPLVELTRTKQLTYGELLSELGARLLELGGYGAGHAVCAQWPSLIPSDPKGEAEAALLHEQLGASKDTLLTRLGFDPKAEAEKKQAEEESAAHLMSNQLRRFDHGTDF